MSTSQAVLDRAAAAAGLSEDDADVLAARGERWLPQVRAALDPLFPDPEALLERCMRLVARSVADRPPALRRRDRRREVNPDWFLSEEMVGYVAYADRFAGTLRGIVDHLDHLQRLHVTYLHLMPLLHPRPAPNDGGYAVVDYDAVDPRLGDMADLQDLATTLHDRGINLCVDVVLNHTAAEHGWARRAQEGDPRHLAYYRTYPDRDEPDRWERSLPQVFPDTAPGNFTWSVELGRWVWTTFNPWQWDLDWSNPDVVVEMLGVMLRMGGRGVDVLRLDAIPFLWKRMGTSCQNLPEVHLLLQALRGLVGMAAPAMALKGEAIVAPDDLVPYQGVGRRTRTECDLLYHNQLMVQGWSSLAAQDGRLATIALGRMAPTPPHAGWVTYVRCHDDIGWAIHDADAAARGWDGPTHRRFLSGFYAGELDISYAAGAHFQEDFVSGDRRTSGTTASLAGLTRARASGDEVAVDAAIARILLLHALAASYGGIPLLYAGDEVGLAGDDTYRTDPARAGDNRWMHRPPMDWDAVTRAADPTTVEGRVLDGISRLMAVRRRLPTLRGGGTVAPVHHDNDHVLAFRRHHPRTGSMVGLANFAPGPQTVDPHGTGIAALEAPRDALADDGRLRWSGGRVEVPGLAMCWVTEDADGATA